MPYYINRTIDKDFKETIAAVTEALKREGFGVLTQINMADKFREKLNVNFRNYVILGACNPPLAHKALQLEDKIGVMLPCNIVIQEWAPGQVEIAAIDPTASMEAVDNMALDAIASEVSDKLKRVVDSI